MTARCTCYALQPDGRHFPSCALGRELAAAAEGAKTPEPFALDAVDDAATRREDARTLLRSVQGSLLDARQAFARLEVAYSELEAFLERNP